MRYRVIWFFISCLIIIVSSGCTANTKEEIHFEREKITEKTNQKSTEKIEITLWSFYGEGWEYPFHEFKKLYPEIDIKVEAFSSYENYAETYLEALLSEKVPDIMVFDSDQFRNFKDIDGLEDLSKDPYQAEDYGRDFPQSLWQIGKSIDNKKIVGIPFSTTPLVTFYRKDIMEQYGFPSEPEELAAFMEDPENWLEMGRTLKEDNKFILQWPNQIINIYESSVAPFNHDFIFNRNNEIFHDAILLSQNAYHEELAAEFDIYMPEGQTALKDGKLAMLYLGTYGSDQLKQLVPNQSGKWRTTRLPFNMYGWSNSSILSIPSNSDQKEAAWKFIKFYSSTLMEHGFIGSVPGYLPARNNPTNIDYQDEFLGGQQSQQLFEEVMSKTEEHFITPLDEEAENIWKDNIDTTIQWNIDPTIALDKITQDIAQNLGQKQKILRENLD